VESLRSFEELEVWKKCRELRLEVSRLVKTFPSDEKYKLIDQMIRCSRSVTNNIAEGYGRYHYQENIQFCRHSRGSLFELKDHFIIAKDENYIVDEEFISYNSKINAALALLNGYINYLGKKKQTDNR
jgi:four helix bundle protein